MLLHIIGSSNQNQPSSSKQERNLSAVMPTLGDFQSHIADSYKMVSALYGPFKNKAKEQVHETTYFNFQGFPKLR